MPEPSKQAVEEASEFFPAEWSEQEARAEAANALQAAYAIDYPALLEQARSEVEGEVRERLMNLWQGPGPDRDERYQDAWRAGVSDARDAVLFDLSDSTPDTEEGE